MEENPYQISIGMLEKHVCVCGLGQINMKESYLIEVYMLIYVDDIKNL